MVKHVVSSRGLLPQIIGFANSFYVCVFAVSCSFYVCVFAVFLFKIVSDLSVHIPSSARTFFVHFFAYFHEFLHGLSLSFMRDSIRDFLTYFSSVLRRNFKLLIPATFSIQFNSDVLMFVLIYVPTMIELWTVMMNSRQCP